MHNSDAVFQNHYDPSSRAESPDNIVIGLYFQMELSEGNYFELLQEAVQYADDLGFNFACIIDENHDEPMGRKLNPAIIHSALAVRTSRIELRGECLSPERRDAIRTVEDWSVIDNLSNGRIGVVLSSGSGQPLFDNLITEHVEELRKLWKGDAVKRINGVGNEVELKVFPRPVREDLPIWLSMREINDEVSFIKAGEFGFYILTSLVKENNREWLDWIRQYKKAASTSAHLKGNAKVTLLADLFENTSVHAESANSAAVVLENNLPGFYEYIKNAGDSTDEIAFRIDLAVGKERVFKEMESLASYMKLITSPDS